MIQRYHNYTIVLKSNRGGEDNTCVVFEGDSDEAVGEFESIEDARVALDQQREDARCNGDGRTSTRR